MIERLQVFWRKRKTIIIVAALAVSSIAVFGFTRFTRHPPAGPTFEVKRGEFVDAIQFRGELKAMKSVTISAPANAGNLQILKLASDGSTLKAGDVIVEFDPSKTEQELKTDESILKSAQAEIEQVRAQGLLTEEKDRTAVMKAQYDLDSAKLEASKSEIVSKIEGAEAQLKVDDAEQALQEAQIKLKSDRAANLSSIEDKKHASVKANYDAQRAQHALSSMALKVPTNGTISLVSVWHDGNEGPFKAGERAWPGAPIAELPDAASIRISARVDEAERGRLAVSQAATVQLDAIADRQFAGKLEHIGTIATSDFSAGWPIPRNFDVEIALDESDRRLKPGMTVQLTVIIDRIPDAITIPTQASFSKSGQPVAYVWDGSRFKEHSIRVERTSRDRALVSEGLRPGDLVALKDPTTKE
jgi:multidrug efflux pump subunit AcrA (membrane-fusion protein)